MATDKIQIKLVIPVFKEDPLPPITSLRHMIRNAFHHNSRDARHQKVSFVRPVYFLVYCVCVNCPGVSPTIAPTSGTRAEKDGRKVACECLLDLQRLRLPPAILEAQYRHGSISMVDGYARGIGVGLETNLPDELERGDLHHVQFRTLDVSVS